MECEYRFGADGDISTSMLDALLGAAPDDDNSLEMICYDRKGFIVQRKSMDVESALRNFSRVLLKEDILPMGGAVAVAKNAHLTATEAAKDRGRSDRERDENAARAYSLHNKKLRDAVVRLGSPASAKPVKQTKPKPVKPKAAKPDVQSQLLEVMGQMQTIRERIANAVKAGKAQSGIDVYQAGLEALQERAKALKAQR